MAAKKGISEGFTKGPKGKGIVNEGMKQGARPQLKKSRRFGKGKK